MIPVSSLHSLLPGPWESPALLMRDTGTTLWLQTLWWTMALWGIQVTLLSCIKHLRRCVQMLSVLEPVNSFKTILTTLPPNSKNWGLRNWVTYTGCTVTWQYHLKCFPGKFTRVCIGCLLSIGRSCHQQLWEMLALSTGKFSNILVWQNKVNLSRQCKKMHLSATVGLRIQALDSGHSNTFLQPWPSFQLFIFRSGLYSCCLYHL